MLKQTLEILSSYDEAHEVCVMGNVAMARGAIEAGVQGVFAYPGTPSTEISEVFQHLDQFVSRHENRISYPELCKRPIYFEYSINEKIALEKAIAFSIGHQASMCVMKNVGMNVACDALMSIPYQRIAAPLVVVLCDDPGCHSSSNEQDSRYWGPMASVPVVCPNSPDDAKILMKEAFRLSGELGLPVIVRSTTRVSHSRGRVAYGALPPRMDQARFERQAAHINIPARNSAAHEQLIERLAQSPNRIKGVRHCHKASRARFGIISSGVATAYLMEWLEYHSLESKDIDLIDIALVHPFPAEVVTRFIQQGHETLLVVEELDPLVEQQVRLIAQAQGNPVAIKGKGFGGLSPVGELTVDIINELMDSLLQMPLNGKARLPLPQMEALTLHLPPRPPTLCAGCPHRATFYLLKLAIPRQESELIMCGDIGCFGLGALPPLRMIDTINHMGMSISMAQGLYEAFHHQAQGKKVVALLGDGTFFHSGLAALVNAVYTRANILVIVFDNRTVGMTGHQSNPGASRMAKYHEMDIAQVVRGLGVGVVENMDPYNIREGMGQLQKAMDHEGVSVLVAKSPCIFLPEYKLGIDRQYQIVVDPKLCNHCANHEDLCLHCSRPYSPISNLRRAKAKLLADISIEGQEQQCPANICNHGFFHSILEGQYKTAVEMVRDKMLFARTCGDICHRPCELFSDREELVPIKALKNFVSSSPQAFTDFSGPISRALKAVPKGYTVGIVGAGPAGLSAAYDLVQMGYEVHLYDREHQPGGMVAFAIPNFRMDKEGLHYESMQLAKMGVQFHFGQEMGKEFELEELRNKYDAVLLALGQGKPRPLAVVETQVPASRRMDALQLLRQLNTGQTATEADGAILVIGGGNSAMDAARAAKRRYPGSAVVVSCLETQDKLPAFPEEFGHALREQVQFIFGSQVHGIQMMANGRLVVGLRDVGSGLALTQMEVGLVVTAIGQVTDTQALGQRRPPLDGQGRVAHHDGQIENGNLFVAGDLAAGNNMSVIGAIGSGKRAANSIRRHFENHGYEYEGQFALDRLNTQQHVYAARPPKPKADVLLKTIERFDLQQACAKCNHCVDNFGCPAMIKENGKVVIDQELCNLCGLCIDVCPNNAISWQVVKTETKPIEKTATPV